MLKTDLIGTSRIYTGRAIGTPLFDFARALGIHLLLLCSLVSAQENEDYEEQDGLPAGLVAEYSDTLGNRIQRIDRQVSFDWDTESPDPRLTAGSFSSRWRGKLFTQGSGKFQLHVFVTGKLKISLTGKTILDRQSATSQWFSSEPLSLQFGWHPLEIEYQKNGPSARVSIYWTGHGFSLEPISHRRLFHDKAVNADESFQRGRSLSRALRCGACHSNSVEQSPAAAPALDKLSGNLNRHWVVTHLTSQDSNSESDDQKELFSRMPSFGFTSQEAESITAYLFHASKQQKEENKFNAEKSAAALTSGSELFHTLGCLACHRVETLGSDDLFSGGDLTDVARKRPEGFFARWLKDPFQINKDHRMPVFELSDKERNQLAAYLTTLKKKKTPERTPRNPLSQDESKFAAGRLLVRQSRCDRCHALPDKIPSEKSKNVGPLKADSDWSNGCTGRPRIEGRQPGYHLSMPDRNALQDYYTSLEKSPATKPTLLDGELVMQERNCLSCHSRGGAPGIAALLPKVIEKHRDSAPLLPAMAPPSLESIGDKLHRSALVNAMTRAEKNRRPWLKIRMPKFSLSDAETEAIVKTFIDQDRIHGRSQAPTIEHNDEALHLAGSRLVSTNGFGCTSCHQVGSLMPVKATLAARGPDLSMLGRRIRKSWFQRFLSDPARIVPRMEMPSVQLPVQGVLNDRLEDQYHALWHVLNQSKFEPPREGAVRVARQSGISGSNARSIAITDILRMGKKTFLKPLLIGLPNRHNVLIDMKTSRLASWWIGDTASQRTQGKTWFWEASGRNLLPVTLDISDISLIHSGKNWLPIRQGQFNTEMDSLQHIGGGIAWQHRLHFPVRSTQGESKTSIVNVTQWFSSVRHRGKQPLAGFSRRFEIRNLPKESSVRLRLTEKSNQGKPIILLDRKTSVVSQVPRVLMRLVEPQDAVFLTDSGIAIQAKPREPSSTVRFRIEYLTDLPADRYPNLTSIGPPLTADKLAVVPGYQATRLPIIKDIMPTGMDWQPDGTLVVSSLKGRVWLAHDTDNDGLEDKIRPFSDELAAPFGVSAHGRFIDVINKYALLRLYDENHDGKAERTETLASGWGHTDDYHDWAIGLPRDDKGNYYITTACQQDDRSLAAAHLRGTVLKLSPRQRTSADPRRYFLETLSQGHRFAIGIALQRNGDLFVTDNQGNWNPYNELNHVIVGKRYGFINQAERRPGFNPPSEAAAVEIPHPWTRSVNGICFLETPPKLKKILGRDVFGPFEGDLVGCEYDTRRLIRISLQKVGDSYQGACYPMTVEPTKNGPALLGPLCCRVSPEGDLFIGSIRDSGWGGANNHGAIVRLRPPVPEKMPAGIAEVKATSNGFEIESTAPVDRSKAIDASNYSIISARRLSTPAYGGDDKDRRIEKISQIRVAEDAENIQIILNELREGFVYEFRLKNLTKQSDIFFPAEAYYTLRTIPK